MLLGEVLTNTSNGPLLVVAIDNLIFDARDVEWLAIVSPANQGFEFGLLEKARDLAWGVGRVVPDLGRVAIGVEDHRPLAVHCFKAIGIKLGLLLALGLVHCCPLGFDNGQWFAIIAPEHVVGIAHLVGVGHASDFVLAITRLVERPANAIEFDIDETLAGLVLVPVVGFRDLRVLCLDCFKLCLNLLEFAFDFLLGVFSGINLCLELFEFLNRDRWGNGRGLRDDRFVEGLALEYLGALSQIGAT